MHRVLLACLLLAGCRANPDNPSTTSDQVQVPAHPPVDPILLQRPKAPSVWTASHWLGRPSEEQRTFEVALDQAYREAEVIRVGDRLQQVYRGHPLSEFDYPRDIHATERAEAEIARHSPIDRAIPEHLLEPHAPIAGRWRSGSSSLSIAHVSDGRFRVRFSTGSHFEHWTLRRMLSRKGSHLELDQPILHVHGEINQTLYPVMLDGELVLAFASDSTPSSSSVQGVPLKGFKYFRRLAADDPRHEWFDFEDKCEAAWGAATSP